MRPLSVIVPTLNEIGNLPILFQRIHASLHAAQIPYEIVVVDDHSTDGTAEFVTKADPKYNASLLLKQGERGKAYSLLEGFEAAQNEIVCMIDADLQYPPEAIKTMYHKLNKLNADVVITKRVDNQTSKLRRLSTFTFNLLFTRLLFGIDYDTQSGLKLFRKDVLRSISLSPSPWTFDLEFIVRALENDYRIISHDIRFSERHSGAAKINMLEATMEIAGGSLRLWRTTSKKRTKQRYIHLQELQNSASLFLGAIVAITCLTVIKAPAVTALELAKLSDDRISRQVASVISSTMETLPTIIPSPVNTPSPSPVVVITPKASPTPSLSPAPSASPSPLPTASPVVVTSTDQSSQSETSQNTPQSSASATPTSTGTAVASTTRSAATTALAVSAKANRTSPTSSTPSSTSELRTLDGQTVKNTAYYTKNAAKSTITQKLSKMISFMLVGAGILLVSGFALHRLRKVPVSNSH